MFEKNPSHTAARNVKKPTVRGPFAEASRIPGCRKVSLVDLSQGVVGIHIGSMYGIFTYIYHKHLDSRYQMYVYIYIYLYVPYMDHTWILRNRELLLDFSGFSTLVI